MAQKIFTLPDIGEIVVAKRRGTRALRLSIRSDGRVRVGIPPWVPYATGLSFALARKEWIIKHQANHPVTAFNEGDLIGKSHRLKLVARPSGKLSSRLKTGELIINVPAGTEARQLQLVIVKAAERALKKQAEHLLPQRLKSLASQHRYQYKSLKIKKLTSRWGSCSSKKDITLNYFLMQLPWELIDYVILHELVHTKHLNHGQAFWNELGSLVADAKARQKTLKTYKTSILAS